jgi:hypothetical protein
MAWGKNEQRERADHAVKAVKHVKQCRHTLHRFEVANTNVADCDTATLQRLPPRSGGGLDELHARTEFSAWVSFDAREHTSLAAALVISIFNDRDCTVSQRLDVSTNKTHCCQYTGKGVQRFLRLLPNLEILLVSDKSIQ